MNKYLIELRRTQESYADVEVEAESEVLAQNKAHDMWEQSNEESDFDWTYTEESCEVVNSEQLDKEVAKE